MKKFSQYFTFAIAAVLLIACNQTPTKRIIADTLGDSDSTYPKHIVTSDDSVITASWWDTGEGGTAEVVETECEFKSDNGKVITEKRPLLTISHPEDDYDHHEIEKIITYEDELGQKTYLFFLRAKVGSNEYTDDIVALRIIGDSLVEAQFFDIGNSDSSDIKIAESNNFLEEN